MTRWGDRVGTLRYMSPEQAAGRNDEVGPASDIYNLGATLYHLLTGSPPYQDEESLPALIGRIQRGDLQPVRKKNRQIPRTLGAICEKAMARKVENRYTSPKHLAKDIERWLADAPVSACRETLFETTSRWTRRHRSWTLAGGTALILVTFVSLSAVFLVNITGGRRAQLARDRSELVTAREIALRDSQQKGEQLKIQRRNTQVQHWINSSQNIRNETPQRSLLLAIEALRVAQQEKLAVLTQAHQNLRNALDSTSGVGLLYGGSWTVSPDLTTGANPTSVVVLQKRTGSILAISSNGRWVAAINWTSNTRASLRRDLEKAGNTKLINWLKSSMEVINPNRDWIATSEGNGFRHWYLVNKHASAQNQKFQLEGD